MSGDRGRFRKSAKPARATITNTLLYLQQHARWIFDGLFDAAEKGDCFPAVDDAVVIGPRDVHHGTNDHPALPCHRPLLNSVHSQDAALRRINDRRGQQGAIDAAVADRESATLELFEFEFAFLCTPDKVGNGELDFGETHSLGMAQNRHHQASAAADRYADIKIVAVDDVVAAYLSVDLRDELERVDRGFDKKRHEAELNLVLLLETCLVLFAQRHDGRHIDLVEGGEKGRGLLRFHEPLRDPSAHRAHRHDFLLSLNGWFRCFCRRLDQRLLFFLVWAPPDVAQHIFLEQASAGPRCPYLLWPQSALGQHPLGRRHHARFLGFRDSLLGLFALFSPCLLLVLLL